MIPLVAVVVAVPLNSEQFRWSECRRPEHEMDHDAPPRIASGRSHNPSVQGSSPCCPTDVSAGQRLAVGILEPSRSRHSGAFGPHFEWWVLNPPLVG